MIVKRPSLGGTTVRFGNKIETNISSQPSAGIL